MEKTVAAMLLVALVVLSLLTVGKVANAEETKMVGEITKIELTGKDAKAATATLKDNKSGESVVVVVNDDLTLDKFKDHRIVEGDEIRCKYETKDGKKVSTYFRKTAGC